MGFSVRYFISFLEHPGIKLTWWSDSWKEKRICENLIRTMPFLPLVSLLAYKTLLLVRVLLFKMWSMDRPAASAFPESYFFFKFYLFIFREGGREGEKHECVVASQAPPTGDLTQACALTELNLRPFGSQAGTQFTEPHQARLLRAY